MSSFINALSYNINEKTFLKNLYIYIYIYKFMFNIYIYIICILYIYIYIYIQEGLKNF